MDILDIDEVLKDDSFCLLENDSEQDDIGKILREWRQNGCNITEGRQVDTRTFTRPKRRSAQNLEPSFTMASKSSEMVVPNIHLKVGGLVTSQMQKSFLQDTSPPSSILSSMDASSIDRMGSSLITSGDFTNVSFFKTAEDEDNLLGAQIAGYNFEDVIKDRKALESLSLSGDSAIIKDCNIAQIDEMNYFSKTNSGNSTMQNSTESMPSVVNDTFTLLNLTTMENGTSVASSAQLNNFNTTFSNNGASTPQEDLIYNTTMTLIDSTHTVQSGAPPSEIKTNLTFDGKHFELKPENFLRQHALNMTFEKMNNDRLSIINRTYYKEDEDKTFELLEESVSKDHIESPVNTKSSNDGIPNALQSTPHRNQAKLLRSSTVDSETPSIKCVIEDVNISPIVPVHNHEALSHEFQLADETKPYSDNSIDQLEDYLPTLSTSFDPVPSHTEDINTEKVLQGDTYSNLESFEKGMDILTDGKDEQEFDDMLEKLGKSSCLEESVKMRLSIDNIKKKHALLSHEKSHEATVRLSDNTIEVHRLPSESVLSSLSSSGSSERLLSRRSRLYDDVQIAKQGSENVNKTICIEDKKATAKTDALIVSSSSCSVDSKTEISPSETNDIPETKEINKELKTRIDRKRDPERFKTRRIYKRPSDDELVVPCIDGEIGDGDGDGHLEEYENFDRTKNTQAVEDSLNTTVAVFNNNKSEVKPSIMYQTYKKPKSLIKPVSANEPALAQPTAKEIIKPRSLSRPKCLSGLARRENDFAGDALPKANSAGDIHRTYNPNPSAHNYSNGLVHGLRKLSNSKAGTASNNPPQTKQLKSPMGTKAKSFTNLAGSNGSAPYGLHSANRLSIVKPNSQPSLPTQLLGTGNVFNNREKSEGRTQFSARPESNNAHQNYGVQKDEKAMFKVPPPVSNLRAPNSRRTGLVRPSSGFYGQTANRSDPEIQPGRYSSSNSISSTSSKGSVHDNQQPSKISNGYVHENSTSNEDNFHTLNGISQGEQVPKAVSNTAPNTARSGIPKPFGLRPPSTARRSGLPRPSSIVRR